jgi:hypothetical protein
MPKFNDDTGNKIVLKDNDNDKTTMIYKICSYVLGLLAIFIITMLLIIGYTAYMSVDTSSISNDTSVVEEEIPLSDYHIIENDVKHTSNSGYSYSVNIIHYDDKEVTCFIMTGDDKGGISCLSDGEIRG